MILGKVKLTEVFLCKIWGARDQFDTPIATRALNRARKQVGTLSRPSLRRSPGFNARW